MGVRSTESLPIGPGAGPLRGAWGRSSHHARDGRGCRRGPLIRLLDVNVLVALAWPNHVHQRDPDRRLRERGGRAQGRGPGGRGDRLPPRGGRTRLLSAAESRRVERSNPDARNVSARFVKRFGARFLPADAPPNGYAITRWHVSPRSGASAPHPCDSGLESRASGRSPARCPARTVHPTRGDET